MHDVFAENGPVRLFIHDDDETPIEFMRNLLRTVFGKSRKEAVAVTARIEAQNGFACGPYPATVAKALLESAQQLIRNNGQSIADHRIGRRRGPAVRSLWRAGARHRRVSHPPDSLPVRQLPDRRAGKLRKSTERGVQICLHGARLAFCRDAAQSDHDPVATISRSHASGRPDRDRQVVRCADPFLRHS
ncbi:ATP-dependent Clp protease adaptor ClpS [Bradyrhizobium sp. USDA 4513]